MINTHLQTVLLDFIGVTIDIIEEQITKENETIAITEELH